MIQKFKNSVFASVAAAAMLFVVSVNAEATEVSTVDSVENYEIAKCTVKDPGGFYATGNCRAVMKHYQQWKSMQ